MNFVDVAQEWFNEGFNPLPLKKDKAPKLLPGHNFLYSPITDIEKRFKNCDKIGIVCGEVSGGFYCIDFDQHDGENIVPIFDSFYENIFIQNMIHNDQLIFYKTPSGGFHGYFKLNQKISGTVFSRWSTGKTMIELRGNGQYIATHPSEGYEYVAGGDLIKLQPIDADVVQWIFDYVKTFDQLLEHTETTFSGKSTRKWPDKWDDKKVDGNFNNTQGDLAKTLLTESGWNYISTRKHDGVQLWQRPGKNPDEGISATFGAKFNMFYCFSSNALPFEQNKAYTPFNIYTLLKFNGDWKKAKDSLKPAKIPDEPKDDVFPISVFPEMMQDYIMELNRTLNFHVDFLAASCMFAIATLNGNKYKLRVKNGWDAQTIFWFACVGYPGTIKTHPVKTLLKPIHKMDELSKRAWDVQMSNYNESAKTKPNPKPKFYQLLISDYTLEALHSIHDINKRGIGLYKDELKGFLNDMNKYRKGSDEEFWLESFNNGSYIVNRVTKDPIMINNICINIIGTIQHDVLSKVVVDYKGNGLIDRFLFTSAESKVYNLTSEEIDNYFAETWAELLENVNGHFYYDDASDTEVLTLDAETFAIYQEIDEEYVIMQNSEDNSQEIKNYLSKMKTYVPRFALLFAIMDSICDGSYVEVLPKHMTDAGRVAKYFIKTASSTFAFNQSQAEIRDLVSSFKGLTRNEQIIKLAKKDVKINEIAKFFGLTRQAVHKILKP